ncbi:MAG TPA: DUF2878 family protein [Legionella sp.]|nr:DUF2878 family protein [Legionella sp.]
MKKLSWIIHSTSYYITWVACIYFAARNSIYLGPLITLAVISLQIYWQWAQGLKWLNALTFSLLLGLCGTLMDTLFLRGGFIYFNGNPFDTSFTAPWMIALWLSFGFNVVVLNERFMHHYLLWAALSFLSVPFSYWLGVKWGAAILLDGNSFYFYLGIVSALSITFNFYLYNHKYFITTTK